ncbi:hypothetical protein EDC01DRAFT_647596 [Geopyxis carbonaria]|nr:hypothetical protein EDC01DRAFT_647596 [Geopyxis carbonaria]
MRLSLLLPAVLAFAGAALASHEDDFPRNIEVLDMPKFTRAAERQAWSDEQKADITAKYKSQGDAEVTKRLKLFQLSLDEHSTIDGLQADWHCTDAEYARARTAYDSALNMAADAAGTVSATKPLFRQIFGNALPKAKAAQTGNPAHVKAVFEGLAGLRQNTGYTDPRLLRFVCHKKYDGGCGRFTYAFVPQNSGQIHLCPKFWAQSTSLDDMPRSIVDLKTAEFCRADSAKLMDLNAATILHELTHSFAMLQFGHGVKPTNDHGYDIRYWWKFVYRVGARGVKGTIFDLTPAQAEDNADSYAWFAVLHLREKLCGIKIVRMSDKLNCRSDHWILKLTSKKGEIDGDEGEGSQHSGTSLVRRAAAKGKTQKQGDVCCPKGQKEVKKKNPKTGKMETDCKCAKVNMVKKGLQCIACPKGQKADPTQTKCIPITKCKAGQKSVNGKCVAACPAGQKMGAQGKCVKDPAACKAGQKKVNGKCVATAACKAGQKKVNGKCVANTAACKAGQKKVNGKCVATGVTCKAGQKKVNGKCVTTKKPTNTNDKAKLRAQKQKQLKAAKAKKAKQVAARNKRAKTVRAKAIKSNSGKGKGGKGGKGKGRKKAPKCKAKGKAAAACAFAGVAF